MVYQHERLPTYNGLLPQSPPKREWKQKSNAQRKRESDALDAELARKQRADDVSPDKRPDLWMVLNDETAQEYRKLLERNGKVVDRAYVRLRNLFNRAGEICETQIQFYFYISRSGAPVQSVMLHESVVGPGQFDHSAPQGYTYKEISRLQKQDRIDGGGADEVEF